MPRSKRFLIVVDMQNDFITGVLGSPEAQAVVPKVVEKIAACQAENVPIICTMDTHHPEPYPHSDEGRKLPIHCDPDANDGEGWSLHPDIIEQLGSRDEHFWCFIKKNVYGSYHLAERLRNHHPDYVELVGLCTDVCVISNAILARSVLPRATIVVDASCCAGVTAEGHQAALQVLKSCGVNVINENV